MRGTTRSSTTTSGTTTAPRTRCCSRAALRAACGRSSPSRARPVGSMSSTVATGIPLSRSRRSRCRRARSSTPRQRSRSRRETASPSSALSRARSRRRPPTAGPSASAASSCLSTSDALPPPHPVRAAATPGARLRTTRRRAISTSAHGTCNPPTRRSAPSRARRRAAGPISGSRCRFRTSKESSPAP
jgi:hypothetical protein